jgi:pseudaminic acid biosynthesis-associated methylase
VYHQSIIDFKVDYQRDLVISSGVLIHMNPNILPNVYCTLYNCTKKYILIAEYYSSVPVEVEYRGNKQKLFKRDFAGEILDSYPDLKLIEYGFIYHRDNIFPQDDLTWFLLSK